MSAPRTNIDKQLRHHRWQILGMVAVVLLALLGFVWWLGDETNDPAMPGDTPVEDMAPADDAAATAPEATTEPAPAGSGG